MKTAIFLTIPTWQGEVIWGIAPQLQSLDWKFGSRGEKPDLIIAHQDFIGSALIDYDAPIVILERCDGCQLSGPTRRNISDPRVRMVLKSSTFADASLHNKYAGRAFCEPENRPRHPIADGDLAKIGLAFGYGACKRIQDFAPDIASWPLQRDVRCSFAGTVNYVETPWITDHRLSCVESLNLIPGCKTIAGRRLEPADYWRLLSRSIASVSPAGCGEICWRTVESVLAGCVLIQPNFGYAVAEPDGILRSVATVDCRPDWSDLSKAIEQAEKIFEPDIVRRGHDAEMIKLANTPESLAKRLAGLFEEVVSE